MNQLEAFAENLERSLYRRYQECNDGAATPSSILLAVLNAVADAKAQTHAALALSQSAEVEALRAEVDEWKASFHQAADGHATYAERAERLAEALKELITWIPSADTYRRLGFDPEAPMRAFEKARAALRDGEAT